MIVDRRIVIDAAAAETFERVVDIPFVGECLPGASGVRDTGDGVYAGNFIVKVGPVKVNLDGTVSITEHDVDARRAVLQMRGSDRRVGGEVVGRMDLAVEESGETASLLVVHTEFTISGKLGQFGQAVMLKKADQITEGFVDEFSRRMGELPVGETTGTDTGRPIEIVEATGAGAVPGVQGPDAVRAAAMVQPGAVARSEPGVVAPVDMVDPMPLLHALLGLLRRSRHFTHIESRADLGDKAVSAEPVWITHQAMRSGVRGADVAAAPAYVVEARLGRPEDVPTFWRDATRAGLDAAAAIALTPMGPAVADVAALAELGAALATQTGRPVLVVATTPWSLMSVARVAQTGVVHGIVADTGAVTSGDATTWMCLAVEEVRRAGLESPLLAGPSASSADDDALRAAGADGVIRRHRSRNPVRRVTAARRR
ncbi:SRPBCC domain-containing protein [Nocardioides sp. T5]|uniref:SRPBCC domain-containing protein n=1 Tax=Nocardioides sp. T5 TaxID=3400182 RepID=UPI003A8C7021